MTSSTTFTEIKTKQEVLENHPVFTAIQNLDDLKLFMSWHVFAVWDFMCLVKRLQRDLTSVAQLWMPSDNPLATRLINEIVLSEESDAMPGGGFASHFELYLMAMKEVGANTTQIEDFIARIQMGTPVSRALEQVSAHPSLQDFVNNTMNTVVNGSVHQVLGSFFFGREDVIPEMFRSLLDSWCIDENDTPMFVYYLKRHIELDGDSHGPAAKIIIGNLTQDNPNALRQLALSAVDAINDRINLWDGLTRALSTGKRATFLNS